MGTVDAHGPSDQDRDIGIVAAQVTSKLYGFLQELVKPLAL